MNVTATTEYKAPESAAVTDNDRTAVTGRLDRWAIGRPLTRIDGKPGVITAPQLHISPNRADPMWCSTEEVANQRHMNANGISRAGRWKNSYGPTREQVREGRSWGNGVLQA